MIHTEYRSVSVVLIFVSLLLFFLPSVPVSADAPGAIFPSATGAPIAEIVIDPPEYTHANPNIYFTIDPNTENFDRLILPNETQTTEMSVRYNVTINAVYRFTMVDTGGAKYFWDVEITNVDKYIPDILIEGVVNGETYTEATPLITVTDEGVSGLEGYTVTLDEQPYVEGTPIKQSGIHTLKVFASDIAGNMREETVTFTINEKPSLSLNLLEDEVARNELSDLVITSVDNDQDDLVFIQVNAGTTPGASDLNSALSMQSFNSMGVNSISFNNSAIPLERFVFNSATNRYEQTVYFEVMAEDTFGNVVTDSITLLIVNHSPVAKTFENVEIVRGQQLSFRLFDYFSDVDKQDTLTYTAYLSDPSLVSAEMQDTTLTMTGVDVGVTTLTIIGKDDMGATVEASFDVKVNNQQPLIVREIQDISGVTNEIRTINLLDYFKDPDEGDYFKYAVLIEDKSVAEAGIAGNELNVSLLAPGKTSIIVTAEDNYSSSVQLSFNVVVTNELPTFTANVNEEAAYFKKGDTITVTGTIADLEQDKITVMGKLGSVMKYVEVANGNGSWTLQWSADELADGTYESILFQVVDKEEIIDTSSSIYFVVDKVAPLAPSVTKTKGIGQVTFNVKFDEAEGFVEWKSESGTWTVAEYAVSVNKAGAYYFRGFDKAGNESPIAQVIVTEDELSEESNLPEPPKPPMADNPEKPPSGNTDAKPPVIQKPTVPKPGTYPGSEDTEEETERPQLSGESGIGVDPITEADAEKPPTLEERIRMVLAKNESAKSQWMNIYVENILNTFSESELYSLQANVKKIDLLVEMTNKIEDFRHKRSTKTLYNMHQYFVETKEAAAYKELFQTTDYIETRALQGVVPYSTKKLSLYQPVKEDKLSNDIGGTVPKIAKVGESVKATFVVNETARSQKPTLSVYVKKDDAKAVGYIGSVFEWVKVSEEPVTTSKGKTEVTLVFNEPGSYTVKSQLIDKNGKAVASVHNVIVEGNAPIEEPVQGDEVTQPAEQPSDTGEDTIPEEENQNMIIIAGTITAGVIGLGLYMFLRRRF